MMLLMKAMAAIFAGLLALCAALLGLASGIARGTTDPAERRDATITAFWSLVVFVFCAGAILTLSGCMSAKELECLARDNTSHPCN